MSDRSGTTHGDPRPVASAPAASHRFDGALAWYFVIVWGSGYIATRAGLMHAPPFTFLSIRFGIAALCMLAVVAVLRPATAHLHLGHLIVAGLLMYALNLGGSHYAQYLGLAAGTSALILAIQPLLTAALASRWLGQRTTRVQWAGVVVGLAGVAMVVAHKIGLAEVNAGNLASVIVALIAMTSGTLYQRRFCPDVDLRIALLVQLAVSWLAVTPLAFVIEGFPVDWSAQLFLSLGFLIVFGSILANMALHLLMRHGEATRVTSILYLTPIIAVLLEWWLFATAPTLLTVAGGAITCLGVALASWRAPAQPGTTPVAAANPGG